MKYALNIVQFGGRTGMRTFFCNRTTLVHFLSNRFSYFLAVALSNWFSLRSSSVLRAVAVAVRFFAVR